MSGNAEPAEDHRLAYLEPEVFVKRDRSGVGFGDVQERALVPGGDQGAERAHQMTGVASGAVQTALISVQPGGRNRSPAMATRLPFSRMPR